MEICLNINELVKTSLKSYSQAANVVIALVAKALKRDKEWFS